MCKQASLNTFFTEQTRLTAIELCWFLKNPPPGMLMSDNDRNFNPYPVDLQSMIYCHGIKFEDAFRKIWRRFSLFQKKDNSISEKELET